MRAQIIWKIAEKIGWIQNMCCVSTVILLKINVAIHVCGARHQNTAPLLCTLLDYNIAYCGTRHSTVHEFSDLAQEGSRPVHVILYSVRLHSVQAAA